MELQIRNLSKSYANGVRALNDVTLTIPRGMFGLLGPNGAGKSTLMRTIATLQEPDEGSIHFGDRIDVLRQKDRVRETLGYLPQEFGVYPNVTAERLLEHFAVLKGITERRARKEIVDALLQQTNLYEVRKKKLGGYSGGMRQRFGVAVALLGNPKLIIVDEPTAGLDPAERVRFLNLLSELGEDAVVILSTHIVDDVSELCSRLAIIDKGAILLEAEPLRRSRRCRDGSGGGWSQGRAARARARRTRSSRRSSSRDAPSCASTARRRQAPGSSRSSRTWKTSTSARWPATTRDQAAQAGPGHEAELTMKLWEIFRFEIGHQSRRVSTWICTAILLLLTFYMTRGNLHRQRAQPGLLLQRSVRHRDDGLSRQRDGAAHRGLAWPAMPLRETCRRGWIRSSTRHLSTRPSISVADFWRRSASTR